MFKMQTRFEKAIGCSAVLFLLVAGIASAHDAIKVFSDPPGIIHVDIEKDMLVIGTNAGFYAQSMATGKRLWSRSLPDGRAFSSLQFGVEDVVIEEGFGILVLDKATGKDRWRHEDQNKAVIEHARFIGSSRWIAAHFYNGRTGSRYSVVYSPEGQALKPPFQDETLDYYAAGWMPDGKTLLLTQGGTLDSLNTLTTYFWQPENNAIEQGYVLTSKDRPSLYYVSPSGKAVFDELNMGTYKSKFTLIDAQTGMLGRILENPETGYRFTLDGHILTGSAEADSVTAVNLDTDDAAVTIMREGHIFNRWDPIRAHGKNWVYSWDKSRRCWLWPLEEGAIPRMIWETPPGRYSPGTIMAIRPPHVLFDTRVNMMEAFLLEGMERIKTWRAAGSPKRHFTKYVCADLHRALAWYIKEDAENLKHTPATQVFEASFPEPIREISGAPRSISPDGRYCVVQHPSDGPFHLVEIDSGRTCAVVQAEKAIPYEVVFFSPNSRYMAVHVPEEITVIHLENEYTQAAIDIPQKYKDFLYQIMTYSVAFSPDGALIVSQGLYGYTTMYSSATGEVVRTVEEPEMVTARHVRPSDGFFETAANFGKRLAGRFVTLDPEPPKMTAGFSADGKHLITLAEGQILRVWDIPSGKLIRTIRTGLSEKRNAYGKINNHLVLSRNGAYAFAFNSDGFDYPKLWDVSTGKLLRQYTLPNGKISEVIVADDGSGVYFTINEELYALPGVIR